MRTGRPNTELILTADERHTLDQWARRPKTAPALARRARIVLACATGKTNRTVAAELKTTADGRALAATLCRATAGRVAG